MNAVQVKGFSKNYGSTLAVKNISFTIHEGEIVGFVGKNGAVSSVMVFLCYVLGYLSTRLGDKARWLKFQSL